MPKIRTRQANSLWLRQRELGIKFPLGHSDRFHKTLYSSIQPVTSWDHALSSTAAHGGVFNLEYSPDGSLLLAACEKKSILMFDPLRRRLIHSIDNAHNDCVNCVRFLDQRMFATCSDDSTVALWDARNLKQRIRTLQGHSNWVKNIEYSPKDSLLLTSGFDGSIYTWDINSFTENSILYRRVFHTNGLMRTRLSPDASKMLISTTSGYLIIIHNLKLSTLTQDLAGFRPNMYRLMQSSQTTIPYAMSFTHLFSQSRTHNRVEFLTDFPIGDDAEVISSLQVHPQGWCALSRNVSNGEKSEWTCIHDIQERDSPDPVDQTKEEEAPPPRFDSVPVREVDDFQQESPPSASGIMSPPIISPAIVELFNERAIGRAERRARARRTTLSSTESPGNNSQSDSSVEVSSSSSSFESPRPLAPREDRHGYTYNEASRIAGDIVNFVRGLLGEQEWESDEEYWTPRTIDDLRPLNIIDYSTGNVELNVSTTDVWEAHVAIREARLRRLSRSTNNTVVIMGDRIRVENRSRRNRMHPMHQRMHPMQQRMYQRHQTHQPHQTMYAIPRNRMIHKNTPRLTHYIEEPNVGSGYIKELCFSADGRLICSPFGYGVRLLAFSSDCSELSNCVPPYNESMQLHELAANVSHSGIVVSTKFSPRHCLLVSGCLSGKIVWHQPVV